MDVIANKRRFSSTTFQAVNKTPIPTYGEKSLTLDSGLRRTFRWIFVIADLALPISGADFVAHFGLQVDVAHLQLVDAATRLSINGLVTSIPSLSPFFSVPPASDAYTALLARFPALSCPNYHDVSVKHKINHIQPTIFAPLVLLSIAACS